VQHLVAGAAGRLFRDAEAGGKMIDGGEDAVTSLRIAGTRGPLPTSPRIDYSRAL
jgi:hypothetical protein